MMRGDDDLVGSCRVAAQAALEVIGKYYSKVDDCWLYATAVCECLERVLNDLTCLVLDPSKKRKHFEEVPWDASDINSAVKNARALWKEFFPSSTAAPVASSLTPVAPVNKYARRPAVPTGASDAGEDALETYLASPVVPAIDVERSGGVLTYWKNLLGSSHMGRLAEFALSVLSTPGSLPRLLVSSSYRAATSVDGERSFSAGKHRCNHLQHAQSVATFQAKVSLASWIQDNAIFTDEDALVSRAAAILKTGKIGAEKRRAREAEIMLIDEDEE
jgi:hypothetical protein